MYEIEIVIFFVMFAAFLGFLSGVIFANSLANNEKMPLPKMKKMKKKGKS